MNNIQEFNFLYCDINMVYSVDKSFMWIQLEKFIYDNVSDYYSGIRLYWNYKKYWLN